MTRIAAGGNILANVRYKSADRMDQITPPPSASWQTELDEFADRKRIAQQMGGPERVARQHAGERLTVRERIDQCLDIGSFLEVGPIAGKATYDETGKVMMGFMPSNGAFGRLLIDGRAVVTYGDDFTMRGGSAVTAISAIHQSTIPWCAVVVLNVFGVGGGGYVPHTLTPARYAWPSGNWGSLPLEGGVETAYRAEIAAANDPDAKLKETDDGLEQIRSPFRSGEAFIIEEIIDPRDARPLLCEFANMAAPLRTYGQSMFTMRP